MAEDSSYVTATVPPPLDSAFLANNSPAWINLHFLLFIYKWDKTLSVGVMGVLEISKLDLVSSAAGAKADCLHALV